MTEPAPREPSRTPVYVTFAIGVVVAIIFAIWKVRPRERDEPIVAPQPAATGTADKVEQTPQNR